VITNARDLTARRQAFALLFISAAGTVAAILVWWLVGWLQAFFVLLLDVVVLTGLLAYLVGDGEAANQTEPQPEWRPAPPARTR
jgi:hypothetical protein